MTKLKELNDKNFQEIITIINSICSNIQRLKNLKKQTTLIPKIQNLIIEIILL